MAADMIAAHDVKSWNLIEPVISAAMSGDSSIVGWLVGNTVVAIGIGIAAILVDRWFARPATRHTCSGCWC